MISIFNRYVFFEIVLFICLNTIHLLLLIFCSIFGLLFFDLITYIWLVWLATRFPPVLTFDHVIVVAVPIIIISWHRKSCLLSSIKQLLFVFNLQRVKSACCTDKTNSVILDINDHSMLSHKCASEHYILLILNICRHAVLIVILHVKILTWEPIVSIHLCSASRILLSVKHESKNRQRFEELKWTIFKLIFVVIPTKVASLLKVHFTFTVVHWIHCAEPFKMSLNKQEKLSREVRECCTRINHHCVLTPVGTSDNMIIHLQAIQPNKKVSISALKWDPGGRRLNKTTAIKASKLKVAAILAQT